MTKKVAVVLSGCGVFDGSEIYEATLTLLRLDQKNAIVQCFAPDMEQMHVINHLTGEVCNEKRNVLVEAARLARGDIKAMHTARAEEFDALIVPGGFGAAKNLSNFAVAGADMVLQKDFLAFARTMHQAKKPIGLICIAPTLSAAICGNTAICTIGNDDETAHAIEKTGAIHQNCPVSEICIDENNLLITTPAYMLANRISEAAEGINKLVDAVLARA
ncbi:MAG: isoprenoid biosynthesis glyoxalase ElbB [Pseudomonadales bacterium]|nr:isoprenoid biosynthesis glyoxalase ElbB [Pseudomonadales bacterium]